MKTQSLKSKIQRKCGFTLVELLVAISIIAVLSAILLPNFMGARERARDAKKKEEMQAIKNALRTFYNDTQTYPDAPNWTVINASSGIGRTIVTYMPGATGIGYTYEYKGGLGDSFFLRVATDVVNAPDNGESQLSCGVGTTEAGYFYVCAY